MGDPIVGAGLSNRAKSIMPGETGTETGTVAGGTPPSADLLPTLVLDKSRPALNLRAAWDY